MYNEAFWLNFFYSPTAKPLSRGAVKKIEPKPSLYMCVPQFEQIQQVMN